MLRSNVFTGFFDLVKAIKEPIKEGDCIAILNELDAVTRLIRHQYRIELSTVYSGHKQEKEKYEIASHISPDTYERFFRVLLPSNCIEFGNQCDLVSRAVVVLKKRAENALIEVSDQVTSLVVKLNTTKKKELEEKIKNLRVKIQLMNEILLELQMVAVNISAIVEDQKSLNKSLRNSDVNGYIELFYAREIEYENRKALDKSADAQSKRLAKLNKEKAICMNISSNIVDPSKLDCYRKMTIIDRLIPKQIVIADKGVDRKMVPIKPTANDLQYFFTIWGKDKFSMGSFEQFLEEAKFSYDETRLNNLKSFIVDLRAFIGEKKSSGVTGIPYDDIFIKLGNFSSNQIPLSILQHNERLHLTREGLLAVAYYYVALSAGDTQRNANPFLNINAVARYYEGQPRTEDHKQSANPFVNMDKARPINLLLAVAQNADLGISTNFSEEDVKKIIHACKDITGELDTILHDIAGLDKIILKNKYMAMVFETRHLQLLKVIKNRNSAISPGDSEIANKIHGFMQSISGSFSADPNVSAKDAREVFLKSKMLDELKEAKLTPFADLSEIVSPSKTTGYEICCSLNKNPVVIYFKYNGKLIDAPSASSDQVSEYYLKVMIKDHPTFNIDVKQKAEEKKQAIKLIIDQMTYEQLNMLASINDVQSHVNIFSLLPHTRDIASVSTSTSLAYPDYQYLTPSKLLVEVDQLSRNYDQHNRLSKKLTQNRFEQLKPKIMSMSNTDSALGRAQVHEFYKDELCVDYQKHVWKHKHRYNPLTIGKKELISLVPKDYEDYFKIIKQCKPGEHEYMKGVIELLEKASWINEAGCIIDYEARRKEQKQSLVVGEQSKRGSSSSSVSSSTGSVAPPLSPISSSFSSSVGQGYSSSSSSVLPSTGTDGAPPSPTFPGSPTAGGVSSPQSLSFLPATGSSVSAAPSASGASSFSSGGGGQQSQDPMSSLPNTTPVSAGASSSSHTQPLPSTGGSALPLPSAGTAFFTSSAPVPTAPGVAASSSPPLGASSPSTSAPARAGGEQLEAPPSTGGGRPPAVSSSPFAPPGGSFFFGTEPVPSATPSTSNPQNSSSPASTSSSSSGPGMRKKSDSGGSPAGS